jgi:hypothetical protein
MPLARIAISESLGKKTLVPSKGTFWKFPKFHHISKKVMKSPRFLEDFARFLACSF